MGKEKLLTFGRYPQISLSQARSARDEARALLASGNDPSAKKQEEAAAAKFGNECIFSKVAEQYMTKIIKERRAETVASSPIYYSHSCNL